MCIHSEIKIRFDIWIRSKIGIRCRIRSEIGVKIDREPDRPGSAELTSTNEKRKLKCIPLNCKYKCSGCFSNLISLLVSPVVGFISNHKISLIGSIQFSLTTRAVDPDPGFLAGSGSICQKRRIQICISKKIRIRV